MLLTVAFVSCKTSQVGTGQVKTIRQGTPGTVTLSVIGYGNTRQDAEADAFKVGISTICYRGLSDFAPLNKPWFDNSSTENSGYWTSFYYDKKYLPFVLSQEPSVNYKQAKGSKLAPAAATKVFTLNYEALHRKLVEDGMVRRPFTY